MKKKIVGGIAVLAIAAVAAFNVSLNSQEENLSNINIASVEALANGESGGTPSCTCSKTCPDGKTTASCTGYNYCNCSSGFNSVTCDGVTSSC